MPTPVTDPELLKRLNSPSPLSSPVTDPELLKKLNAPTSDFLTPPSGPTTISQDRPVARYFFHDLLRPVLEYGGAGAAEAGLIATAPETAGTSLLATGAAVAGGYVAGRSLADTIEEMVGLYKPVTPKQQLERTTGDVQTGLMLGYGGPIAGKVTGAALETVTAPFAKAMTTDAIERARLAQAKGLPVTAAEITQDPSLAKLENVLTATPGSSTVIKERHQVPQSERLTHLRGQIAEQQIQPVAGESGDIEAVGGRIRSQIQSEIDRAEQRKKDMLAAMKQGALASAGRSMSKTEVGTVSKEALAANSIEQFGEVKSFYDNLPIQSSEKIAVQDVANTAKSLLKQYEQKNPALQDSTTMAILDDLAHGHLPQQERLKVSRQAGFKPPIAEQIPTPSVKPEEPPIPSMTWGELHNLIKDMGQMERNENVATQAGLTAFKGLRTPEGGIYATLKASALRDLETHSDLTGGELLPALQSANQRAREFYKVFRDKNVRQMIRSNPEQVFGIVARSPTAFSMLRQAVGDDAMQPIKDLVVRDVVGDGEISSKAMARKISQYGENLNTILGADGANDLRAIADGVKRIEDVEVTSPLFRSIAKTEPQKVFDTILSSTQSAKTLPQIDAANIDKLNQIRPIIGTTGVQHLKNLFMQRALGMDQAGAFSPSKALKIYQSFGPRTARAMLGDQGIKDMAVLSQLEEMSKGAQKIAANPSGSAQGVLSGAWYWIAAEGMIKTIAETFTGSPLLAIKTIGKTTGLLLLPKGLAKIYLSDAGRKYLISAYRIDPASKYAAEESAKLTTRLLTIAGRDGYKDASQSQQRQQTATHPMTPESMLSQAPVVNAP